MSNEEQRRGHHRQEHAGSARATAAAAPWPETTELSLSQDDGLTGRIWTFGEFPTDQGDSAGDLATGLTSVGFIRAALRRGKWLWRIIAVAGLLIGLAAYKAFPPSYQAEASILLANNPFEQTGAAAIDDQAIAQSRTVAGAALRNLGLHEDPGVFVGDYTAAILTDRVLTITVKAASYPTAIREANALAAAFLTFQKQQLLTLQALNLASLQQSLNQAKRTLASISARIKSVSAQPPSRAKRLELAALTVQHSETTADLVVLEESYRANEASTKIGTAALINGSRVLDPAGPLPQHAKKYLVLYVGGGLVAGLALGLSIIIIRALISDKLRRRDDVARALGAPVKLSVGKIKQRRGGSGLAAVESTEIQHIAQHLGRAVMPSRGGIATLAVVPVDDPQVAALSLVSLALSCAQEGLKVIVADMSAGSPAAHLLGTDEPGVHTVNVHDAHLLAAIPDPEDLTPEGPLRHRSQQARDADPLAAACASADILLTLAAVGPSLGAEHLAGWSRRAVAVVTAGEATAERVRAVGELIRLAGIELYSAVLVGADETDESLGVVAPPSLPASAGRT